MKRTFEILSLVLLFVNCFCLSGQSDNLHFKLAGKIKNAGTEPVVLTYTTFRIDRFVKNQDTCRIDGEVFTLEGNLSEPAMATLKYGNEKTVSFYIEPAEMYFTLDCRSDLFALDGFPDAE